MSPRKPAALRNGDGQNLREYLITTAARLIEQRGTAGLAVREIAREAQVADGVLYNYFEDKEDLLAQALLAHVGAVMHTAPRLPEAGTGTVEANLAGFIDGGLAVLIRVLPAFAGLLSQPKVLVRFHAMVGGDEAFGTAPPDDSAADGWAADGWAADDSTDHAQADPSPEAPAPEEPALAAAETLAGDHVEPRSLPQILTAYLTAEQQLGRVRPGTDIGTVSDLVVGAIHGNVLPRILFSPPGSPVTAEPGFGARLAAAVMTGIEPPPGT
jgi:AcrR family transcriptional regulator